MGPGTLRGKLCPIVLFAKGQYLMGNKENSLIMQVDSPSVSGHNQFPYQVTGEGYCFLNENEKSYWLIAVHQQ